MLLTKKPTLRSGVSVVVSVSVLFSRAMTSDTVRIFKLSPLVLAPVSISSRIPIWLVNSLYESIALPLRARILSPFIRPIFEAGESVITLSISAGTIGLTNVGVVFSMPSKLMSPGRLRLMALPSRMISTRVASLRSR